MYVFEKQLGRIKVSQLVPNMEEIKKLKDQEVYGKLDYLTMLRAETNFNANFNILLQDRDPVSMGDLINVTIPVFNPGYHKLEEDNYVSEQEAFANLSKVINSDVLKTVKYIDNDRLKYLALTDPVYRGISIPGNRIIREMYGIVPISERLYEANHLIELLAEGDLEKLYTSVPEWFRDEFTNLLKIKEIMIPNIWYSHLEEAYRYGVISGSIEAINHKLEISSDIISRVRRK